MRKPIQIAIPQPCHEKWDEMTPVEKGRFCAACQKNVIDFTNASDREIANAINNNKSLCGRFSPSQLDRDLVVPNEKSTAWTAVAAGVLSFVTLGSYKASAQETITTEQTDNNYNYDSVGILTGIVRDKNDVLADVTIINKTKNDTTVSLLNGDYEILADKGDIIEFSLDGYTAKTITVKSGYHKNIKLKKDKNDTKDTSINQILTISGKIRNNGEPFSYAIVTNTTTKVTTQADINGNYSIDAKKGEILEYTFLGYNTKNAIVSNNSTINILFTEEDESYLGLIVVKKERSFFGRVFHSIGNIFR